MFLRQGRVLSDHYHTRAMRPLTQVCARCGAKGVDECHQGQAVGRGSKGCRSSSTNHLHRRAVAAASAADTQQQ